MLSEEFVELAPVDGDPGVLDPHTILSERVDGLGHRATIGNQTILGGKVNFPELDIQLRGDKGFQEFLESHLSHFVAVEDDQWRFHLDLVAHRVLLQVVACEPEFGSRNPGLSLFTLSLFEPASRKAGPTGSSHAILNYRQRPLKTHNQMGQTIPLGTTLLGPTESEIQGAVCNGHHKRVQGFRGQGQRR